MGILTWDMVQGLNRHSRNALRAALSSIGLPILCVMEAPVTLPLPGSTVTTQTPLPVMRRERASYGYWGRGAFMARAFARDIDIAWALIGVNFFADGGGRGGGVLSSTNSGVISGAGGGSGSGISSGGGVASGGANVASTTVGALGGISTTGSSRV